MSMNEERQRFLAAQERYDTAVARAFAAVEERPTASLAHRLTSVRDVDDEPPPSGWRRLTESAG